MNIYIAEPASIEPATVTAALGDTPHQLVLGSTDFTAGDVRGCDTVLIRSATRLTADVLAKQPQLTRIVRVGVGLDNVDLDYCSEHNITVYNAPGANADAVAEYAVTMMLIALRKLNHMTPEDQLAWNRHKFTGRGLASRSVGIVGYGHIGKLLHAKLHSLGCVNFTVYDPFVADTPEGARLTSLDELLKTCDIVSLHLPLTADTTHCINAEKLALLKPDAILLNAARGGIVDETALLANPSQPLTYIADTVEGEPHVNPALLKDPRVIVTPHIAGMTDDAETAMIQVAIQNLLAGKPAARP